MSAGYKNKSYMNLDEAEIQVLASIEEALSNGLAATRQALDERAGRFWIFKEDWSGVFSSLKNKNLISGDENGYYLTESGRPAAIAFHAERPDLYWYYYQKFYDLAALSKVHSRFCKIVFGEDLCQEGQTDMQCFNDLLSRLHLRPDHHLLDLGCGAGGLSEYVHDIYGSYVTGIDSSESAIRNARDRTQAKRGKLEFLQADLNQLDLPANTFDAAVSIDSIYWVSDLDKTISLIVETIKPGGLLYILIEQRLEGVEDILGFSYEDTHVAKSLSNLKLEYSVVDYSESFLKFWPRVKQVAESLRDEYLSEGTELICDNWIREADEEYLPCVRERLIKRYLFQASV